MQSFLVFSKYREIFRNIARLLIESHEKRTKLKEVHFHQEKKYLEANLNGFSIRRILFLQTGILIRNKNFVHIPSVFLHSIPCQMNNLH